MHFAVQNETTAMQIIGSRGAAVETAKSRLMFAAVCFVLAFSLIGGRVAQLCLFSSGAEPSLEIGRGQDKAADMLALGRSDIVDRNGVLLATSIETYSLYADPKMVAEPGLIAKDLVAIFPDMKEKDIIKKLEAGGRFQWLRRGLGPTEVKAINALGHPGLDFRHETKRFYPQEKLTTHILGFTDVDGAGLSGVERSFNQRLASGQGPLQLTIDVRIQHALYKALGKAMTDFTAKGATGIVMDVHTGEVLAAVSLPDYDPHLAGNADDNSRFNRFGLGVYEMGSTFKTFSTAALLEHVNSSYNQYFDATKPIRRAGFTISDYHPEKRSLSVPEIFMYSSNIGTALMGERVGTRNLERFYKDLGFMAPVPVSLDEKAAPLVPRPWRDISTLTASYGHGIAVTPFHLVRAFSAIVNGGVLPDVKLVKGARNTSQTNVRVISEATSQKMRELLRLVVTHGTGKNAEAPGFMVGGKTGTAEKIGPNGGYMKKKLLSSFVGAFPMNNPRYAVLISVDEPVGNKKSYGYATAGWVAAPAAGMVVKDMARILDLQPVDENIDMRFAKDVAPYLMIEKKGAQVASFER